MGILTRDAILAELRSGRLRVEPLADDQVGAASIDLHLGTRLRLLGAARDGPIPVRDDTDPRRDTTLIELVKPHVLEPGRTALGVTRERIILPPDVCGWLEGRSRIARLGLTVHVTSGFVQPGSANHQVLEMTNVSGVALELHAGVRICQIVLQRCEGSAVYRGQYADQDAP
jgi:dCTP deaminase